MYKRQAYYRFITHLKFFAQRVFNNAIYDEDEAELFDILKEKYKESYNCVLKDVYKRQECINEEDSSCEC